MTAPHCPVCGDRVDRMQKAAPNRPGVVCLYSCQHWIPADTAAAIAREWRNRDATPLPEAA